MQEKMKKLGTLFLANLYISAFTFGGGFVITTFMRKKFVNELKWISDDEMLDLVAIAQTCPGSIAVNCAILSGYHMAGVAGVLVSTLATILPPFLIMIIIYAFYAAFSTNIYVATILEGIFVAVTAIIFDTVFDLGYKVFKSGNIFFYMLMFIAIILAVVFNINAVSIILLALVCGIAYSGFKTLARR